jgi:mono/diheme cytochrome c family protein
MIRWTLLGFLAAIAPAAAQAPDPAAGRALAERWCAQCHVVAPGQTRGADTAPPFSDVAMNPMWWDAGRLGEYLRRPHPVMPNFSVTGREVLDLAAFLRAQRR